MPRKLRGSFNAVRSQQMNARERTRSHERQQTRKDRGRTAKAPGPLLRQKDTCPNSAAFLVRELVGIKDLMKNPDDKARSRQRVGQVEILPAWDFKKVKPQVRSGSTGEEGRWTSSFRIPHGPLSSATLRACEKSPTNQWESRAPWGQRQRRRWIQSSTHGARNIRFVSGSGKILGCNFQTPWRGG